MRCKLAVLALFSFFNGMAQNVLWDKKYDSLTVLANKDTIYEIAFTVQGTTIGGTPQVIVTVGPGNTAKKGIDYALLDMDSLQKDSVPVTAKAKQGKFRLYITGGATQSRPLQLNFTIKDNSQSTTVAKQIILQPYVKPAPIPAPDQKDSLIVRLTKDVDIPVQNFNVIVKKKSWLFFKRNSSVEATINIERIEYQDRNDGKAYFTVYTTDGDIYSNETGIMLREPLSDSDQVHDNTHSNYSLKLKDFLQVSSQPKASATKTLSPQNKTIKIVLTTPNK